MINRNYLLQYFKLFSQGSPPMRSVLKQAKSNRVEGDVQGSAMSHFIGDLKKAPQFLIDNPSITDGYRINFNTPSKILKSLFMIHNESVNIWSHCLPAIILIFILLSLLFVINSDSVRADFHAHTKEIDQKMQEFHSQLKNMSFSSSLQKYEKEAEHQMSLIKASILEGYQQLLDSIEDKSKKMRSMIEENVQNLKSHIPTDIIDGLKQLQKLKRKFQNTIAPNIVSQFQQRVNSSFVNAVKEHLQELKQHLDSSVFKVMELHEETPNPQNISKWPIFVFLLTAVICLLNSTLFHLFHPMGSKTYGLLLRFDFAGISLLISGSAFPCFYYGLYCQMAVATIYLTFTFASAFVCFVLCLFEWVHKHQNIKYRSIIFGIFGMSMSIPLSHLAINQIFFDNYGDPYNFSTSALYYVLLCSSYIMGLYIYTVRCPERNNPGKYNICGHSHQIWHFTVVMGIVFTYFGVMENFQQRKISYCPA